MFGPDPDDGRCSYCGVDMEVIGPPGPRHADDCPYNARPVDEPNLTDAEFKKQWKKLTGRTRP